MAIRISILVALAAVMTLAAAAPALAQSGRIETTLPRRIMPDTKWIKAEAVGENALEQALRAATDQILAERGYATAAAATYVMRVEVWQGAQAPLPPPTNIPGYSNAAPRLSILANRPRDGGGIYVSLTLYHQGSGLVYWQAEIMCPSVAADAASIAATIIKPALTTYWGKVTKPTSFACAPVKA